MYKCWLNKIWENKINTQVKSWKYWLWMMIWEDLQNHMSLYMHISYAHSTYGQTCKSDHLFKETIPKKIRPIILHEGNWRNFFTRLILDYNQYISHVGKIIYPQISLIHTVHLDSYCGELSSKDWYWITIGTFHILVQLFTPKYYFDSYCPQTFFKRLILDYNWYISHVGKIIYPQISFWLILWANFLHKINIELQLVYFTFWKNHLPTNTILSHAVGEQDWYWITIFHMLENHLPTNTILTHTVGNLSLKDSYWFQILV